MTYRALALTAAIALMSFLPTGAHAQAENEIQDLADRWTAAYNSYDKQALGALYREDAALMMHGSPTIQGRAAIADFWEGDFQVGSPTTVLTVTHFVEGFDMMLVHGNYRVIDRESDEQMGGGRFAHIWMLDDDGEWRLDRDLWNQPHVPIGE